MRILGVNGINSHGVESVDLVIMEMANRGYQSADIYLPKRNFISARWGASIDANFVAQMSEPGDVLVAHSFGGLRAAEAMKMIPYSHVFLVNPAMDRDYEFHFNGAKVYCFHSKEDYTILLGSLLFLHPFGAAGRVGFTDERITNVEIRGNHSAAFKGHQFDFLVDYIDTKLKEET